MFDNAVQCEAILFQDDTRGPHCHWDQEPGAQEEVEIRDF